MEDCFKWKTIIITRRAVLQRGSSRSRFFASQRQDNCCKCMVPCSENLNDIAINKVDAKKAVKFGIHGKGLRK
jgi:hypothetical protein